jgi:hypothetical protein
MTNEFECRRDVAIVGKLKLISRGLTTVAEKITERLSQDTQCPDGDSKQAPSGYKYTRLQMYQPARGIGLQ